MVHEVRTGKRTRMSFSRIEEVLDMPDLIEIQKNSYRRFVESDLREVLSDGLKDDDAEIAGLAATLAATLIDKALIARVSVASGTSAGHSGSRA